jgi:hypothetical protein
MERAARAKHLNLQQAMRAALLAWDPPRAMTSLHPGAVATGNATGLYRLA